MKQRRALLIGDVHVASTWAVFPKDFTLSDGNMVSLSKLQLELLSYWDNIVKVSKNCDTIILLGDIIHGLNKKEFGKHLMTSDLNDQKNAAIELLKPICEDKIVIGITGSRYHASEDYRIDEDIVKEFNGIYCDAVGTFELEDTGKIFNIRHGSGALPIHPGSKMDRELRALLIGQQLDKLPNIDCLILGHFHTMAHYYINNKLFVLNGCWEGPRRNLYSAPNFLQYLPDIGSMELLVTKNDISVIQHNFSLQSTKDYIYKI